MVALCSTTGSLPPQATKGRRTIRQPYDQAALLLGALFHDAPPNQFMELRGIPPVGGIPQQIFVPVARLQVGDVPLPYRWDGVFHCYYGLAPRTYRRGTRDAIAVAGCCWGDEITKAPPDNLPVPSIMVETSPGKVQTIWLLGRNTAAQARRQNHPQSTVASFPHQGASVLGELHGEGVREVGGNLRAKPRKRVPQPELADAGGETIQETEAAGG